MAHHRISTALLVLLPFAGVLAACENTGNDRAALEEDELQRELELALEGDTSPSTFEDTAVSETAEPSEPAADPPPARTPEPRTEERTRPEPEPEAPAAAPEPEPERDRERRARPTPRTEQRQVPAGTTFALRLNQTLSTEESRAGDAFTATLDDPIVDADGTVLVPSGATVRGRVTAVEKSDRVGETALLKVAFESLSFGGNSYPMQATVVEATPERKRRTSRGQQAAKVAAGAAAGAILGQVLGSDAESTVKGAAIGVAAGTAIAMGTADVDAVLSSGSRMVIRLDGPVEVPVRAS